MQSKDVKDLDDHHVHLSGLRKVLNEILFDTRTLAGRITNWSMLALIMIVVVSSMFNTVEAYNAQWGEQIRQFELWVLYTFAVEYVLRVYAARNRKHYMFSFNGIVDLITVLPLFVVGDSFVLVRLLRLARVIRVGDLIPGGSLPVCLTARFAAAAYGCTGNHRSDLRDGGQYDLYP